MKRTNLKRLDGHQSGLSMIEVLIAILISVIGLFSVMKMQLTAVSNTHSAYLRSQAAVVSNAMVGSVACVSATQICSLVVQWDDSRGLSGGATQQFTLAVRLQ